MDSEIYGGSIRVRSGALEAVSANGTVIWTWCPPSARVIGVLALPDGCDAIVLIEPKSSVSRALPTVFRVRRDGTLAWTAEVLPGGDGTYVAVEAHGEHIAANTWDGRRAVIDVATGSIVAESFVK